MILLDVNVLIYAHREDAERHAEFKRWLERALGSAPGVGVSDLVLSSCLRIITHPRIFKTPTPLGQAREFIEDFRARDHVHVMSPGPDHWSIFIELCRKLETRGNLIADAYHAALAIELGCQWCTADRGFAIFPGLDWRHPLD
jgi:uncharacterized protein